MNIVYSKPVIKNYESLYLEPCLAANTSGDIPACKLCGKGVDIKEATNAKCQECMKIQLATMSFYDFCQQK